MRVFIKHMVSNSCKILVKNELDKLLIKYNVIELGEIELLESLSVFKKEELKVALQKLGFELLDNPRVILCERIKSTIIHMLDLSNEFPKTNYSRYISQRLLYDYTYLSNVFSEVENITIEHFIIAHKIEKVKELLLYNQYNISQIASMLNYSDVAHLSRQFKKVTGFTPSFYKAMKNKGRISLEDI
jgi:AraC-like DNA-binding protein